VQRKAITIASRSEQRSNRTDKNFAIPDNQRVEILVREASASMAEIKRSLAIVIGINQYVNGIPTLKTAVNDAIKIAHTLETKYQYQVLRLLDEDATGGYLKELFTAFEQKTLPLSDGSKTQLHPDDRLLFYFAGHGIALDALDNADGPVGFLVPQDARMDNDSSLLPMKRLHDALLALPCRHLLVILDCCFAGAFRWAGQRDAVRSQKMYRERYERFISGCAQQVITSAADDEKAADSLFRFGQRSEHEGHSPFAELLLKGLSGEADYSRDGAITATELYVYIHGELGKTSAKQTPGFSQLKRHDKGEYIFPIPGFKANKLEEAPKLDEKANPYKGLESFEEGDSEKFFGRKALIETLQDFVANQPLTVVLGAPGSGKSSLVKAGLIPQLKKEQEQWRVLDPIRPGESPFRALNHALERENLPVFAIPNQPTDDLTSGDASKEGNSSDNTLWYEQGLQNLSSNLVAWRKLYPNSKLLLIIDQSEELVTLSRDEVEREMFLKGLARALNAFPDWLRIVLTLRSDFEPQFRETALEPYWSGARFIVPAMTREELREAIVEPATAKVMYFEPPKLVDQLIDEVVQMPGALPLLSFTLSELYLKYIKSVREGKRNNRAITQEDYEQLGGVARSLTQRADCEYEELKKRDSAYERTVRHVMLRMVAVGGGELARRQVLCTELEYPQPEIARVKEVIERFVAARLLVKGRDIENQEYVEPAHDVLVRGWQKLLSWKQQEQESLILQRRLTPAALEWRSQQQAKFLWNADPRLDLLKQVLNSNDNWFNTLEAEFVRQSIKQKRKNTIRLWSSVIGAFVVLSGATLIAINSARDALKQSLEASINLSESLLSSNRQLEALVEGVKAGERLKKNKFLIGEDSRIRVVTHLQYLIYQMRERNGFEAHTDSVTSVSFSPDGNTIASGSRDNTVKLWRRDGTLVQPPLEHNSEVFSVSFCFNGQTLLSASYDNTIRLWQRQHNGTFKLHKFIRYNEEVRAVSLSPDCQTIATASLKNFTVRIWNLDGKLIKTFLPKHRDQVKGLYFSPDSQIIASSSWDKTIKIWNIKDGKLLRNIGGDTEFYKVIFVDNKTIASASADGDIKVLNLNGKVLKPTFDGHRDSVLDLNVSRDGKTIVSTSRDGTVKLWNREDGKLLKNVQYPGSFVNQASFSPDSKMIALAGEDKAVKLWSREGIVLPTKDLHGSSLSFSSDGQKIISGDKNGNVMLWQGNGSFLKGWKAHDKTILKVAFSPNNQVIASASLDGTVKVWNLNKTLIKILAGHTSSVLDLSFSPDGQSIASASADKTVRLWRLDGSLLQKFEGHNGVVTSVSFSPDGQSIASASADKTVRLWRLDRSLLQKFEGHTDSVLGVSFSPNGKMIASASADKNLMLWSVDGQLLKIIPGHTEGVYRIKFSRSGKFLASVSSDKTIKLWRLDGSLLQILKEHNSPIYDASFNPDDKVIASADFSERLILWSLDIDHLLRQSCNWLHDYIKIQSTRYRNTVDVCKQDSL
jgi:WD40 repeat protein